MVKIQCTHCLQGHFEKCKNSHVQSIMNKNNWCCNTCQGLAMRNCYDVWVFFIGARLSKTAAVKIYKQVLRNWRVWNNRRDTSSLSKRHTASQTDSWHFILQPRVRSGMISCTRLREMQKSVFGIHSNKSLCRHIFQLGRTQKERVSDDGAVVGIPISAPSSTSPFRQQHVYSSAFITEMERRAVPHPEGSTTRLINVPFGWYLHDAALACQRLSFRLNKSYQL